MEPPALVSMAAGSAAGVGGPAPPVGPYEAPEDKGTCTL